MVAGAPGHLLAWHDAARQSGYEVCLFSMNSGIRVFPQVRAFLCRVSPHRVRKNSARGFHHGLRCFAGAVLRRRPQMGVGVQRGCRRRMPQRPLHRHHIAAISDQPAGVKMPEGHAISPPTGPRRSASCATSKTPDPCAAARRRCRRRASRPVGHRSSAHAPTSIDTRSSGRYTTRSEPYFGARTSIPPGTRCTCRETVSVRRRKSTSSSLIAAASPSRRPAERGTDR